MSRTPEYEELLVELKADLPGILYKILEALLQVPRGLNRVVFGEEPQTNLGNDRRDRKIRKGIENLRNRGIPSVSTSGKAGYKLDTNPKNIECMIKEWESRIAHLQHRVEAARGYYDLFVEIFQAKRNDP